MTPQEIDKHIEDIKNLSQEECARLWRFSAIGHVYFSDQILYGIFQTHFKTLGGFTPEISKKIGWKNIPEITQKLIGED